MGLSNRQQYQPVDLEDPDSRSAKLSSGSDMIGKIGIRTKFVKSLPVVVWLSSFVFLLSGLYGHASLGNLSTAKSRDSICAARLNTKSPMLEVLEFEDVQFDNEFWKPSPYKGRPTPELEKRWHDLWFYSTIDLPMSYFPYLNKSSNERWVKTESGGLLAGLEIHHSLHCLDMVRQYTWKSEYDYSANPSFQDDEEFIRDHVDHCIEALRIRIMCNGDVTPFLHTYDESMKVITPDFDTQHRCPKFDQIQSWSLEHATGPAKDHKHGHHPQM